MSRVNFKYLDIKNFSILKEAQIPFENMGMCLIEGRKLTSDDDETDENSNRDRSNGVGKTSIVEAFFFCLTGEFFDSSTTLASIVHRFSKEDTVLTLTGEKDTTPFEIHRTVSVKGKKSDGKAIHKLEFTIGDQKIHQSISSTPQLQESINQFLNIDATLLLNSRIFGQGDISSFTIVNDRQKKILLDNLVGIGSFEKFLKATKLLHSEVSSNITAATIELNHLLSVISSIENDISSLNVLDIQWRIDQSNKLDSYTQKINEINKVLTENTTLMGVYTKSIVDLKFDNTEKDRLEKEIMNHGASTAPINDLIKLIHTEIAKIKTKQEIIKSITQKELNEINQITQVFNVSSLNTESAKCPFCLQIVTIEYLNTILDEIKLRLKGYDDSLNQLNLQLDPLLNQLKTVEEIKHQSEIESQKLRTKLQVEEKAREKYNQLIFVRGRIEITIQAKEKELEVLRDTNKEYSTQENISPYEQLILNKQKDIEVHKGEIVKRQSIINEYDEAQRYYGELVRAFDKDGIPRLISLDAIKVINQLIKQYTYKLLGTGFSIELKMKERGKSEEIYPEIINPKGGLTYYRQSKGEKKAIDLCQQLAFSKFAEMQDKSNFNVKFIDEVFSELDPYTCEVVLEILRDEPIENKFIITHKDLCKEEFKHRIVVTKVDTHSTTKVHNF